jgi:hypothetical protein
MKPANWPDYMIEKRLSGGRIGYYWNPHRRDLKKGFTLRGEALGSNYAIACERANLLNKHLSDWRAGRNMAKELDARPGFGTLDWLIEIYYRTPAWTQKVSLRSQPEYRRAFNLVLDYKTKRGNRVGSFKVNAIKADAVDKIYAGLKIGPRGRRVRQPVICMTRMARAWDVVRRLYTAIVPEENPFRGLALEHSKGKERRERKAHAAARDDAYALHRALVAAGEPHLAVVPLVCFEWYQRPEHVIAGHLKWSDYRLGGRALVRVEHPKTGAVVEMQLADDEGPFFPELTSYLDRLEHLGMEIVLRRPQRQRQGDKAMTGVMFTLRDARKRVRKAADAASLPKWLSLAACRHGGLTELGDAGVTEQEGMATSGHETPEAFRGYVKRTAVQRLTSLRKKRAHVRRRGTSAVRVSE